MAAVSHLAGSDVAFTTNVATYSTASATPLGNALIVCFPKISGTILGTPTLTASANGLTFTLVGSQKKGTLDDTVYCFVSDQLTPASPVAMQLTVDVTADPGTGCIMGVEQVTGMTLTGLAAVRSVAGTPQIAVDSSTGSATPSLVFPAVVLTTNPTLIGHIDTSATGTTQPAGWTEGYDRTYGTPTIGGSFSFRNSGFAGTTINWGGTSSQSAEFAIELDASVPASMSFAARRVNRAAARRTLVSDADFRGLYMTETPFRQAVPVRTLRRSVRRIAPRTAGNFIAPPPAAAPANPALVTQWPRKRVAVATTAKSRIEFVPVPATVVPPPGFVPGVQGRDRVLRGWLSRRSRRVEAFQAAEGPPRSQGRRSRMLRRRAVPRVDVVTTQAAPPVNPDLVHRVSQRRAARGWVPRRAQRVETTPAQVVVTPTLVPRATQRRVLRGWLPRRVRRVETVPGPVVLLTPAYVPSATGRRTLRGWTARKARRVESVPPQTVPPLVPSQARRRPTIALTRTRRVAQGHPSTHAGVGHIRPTGRRTRPPAVARRRVRPPLPVPPQVIVAAPVLVPKATTRRTVRGWLRRKGRLLLPVQPGALNQPARGLPTEHGVGSPYAHDDQPVRPHPSMPPTMRRGSRLVQHSQSGGVNLR